MALQITAEDKFFAKSSGDGEQDPEEDLARRVRDERRQVLGRIGERARRGFQFVWIEQHGYAGKRKGRRQPKSAGDGEVDEKIVKTLPPAADDFSQSCLARAHPEIAQAREQPQPGHRRDILRERAADVMRLLAGFHRLRGEDRYTGHDGQDDRGVDVRSDRFVDRWSTGLRRRR